MSNRKAAAILAGIVIIVGLVLGFLPHHVTDPNARVGEQQRISCGTAFSPDHGSIDAAQFGRTIGAELGGNVTGFDPSRECSSALKTPRVLSLVLIGLGVAGGLFLLLTFDWKSWQQQAVAGRGVPPAASAAGPQENGQPSS